MSAIGTIKNRLAVSSLAGALLAFACVLAASSARADDQATMSGGMTTYGSTTGKSLSGNSGYFLHFQSESRKGIVRPTITAQAEWSNGNFNTSIPMKFLAGEIGFGVELFGFRTEYVKPFISLHGLGGWASLTLEEETSLGLIFGGMVRAGAEVRMNKKENARALRISTGYRYLRGTIATISGFELDAFIVSVGIAF